MNIVAESKGDKRFCIHKWKIDMGGATTTYRRCTKCGAKQILQNYGQGFGYQPVDVLYLKKWDGILDHNSAHNKGLVCRCDPGPAPKLFVNNKENKKFYKKFLGKFYDETIVNNLLDEQEKWRKRLLNLKENKEAKMEERLIYKNAVCRGSYIFGTACGNCERCTEELQTMQALDKWVQEKENKEILDPSFADFITQTTNDVFSCYTKIKDQGKEFITLIDTLCPNTRERSLAQTKIEEAVMWANAAVARRGEQGEKNDKHI
jgi:hypothetical protein